MHLLSFMNIFHKVLELWPGHDVGRTDGQIGGGIKMPELSSLFMTHQLNVMHAPV